MDQLDRIEAKLDMILMLLSDEPPVEVVSLDGDVASKPRDTNEPL